MTGEAEKVITVPEDDGTVVVSPDKPTGAATEAKPDKVSPSAKAAAAEAADILRKQFEDSQAEVMRLKTAQAGAEQRARDAEAKAGQSEASARNSIVGQLGAAIDARTGALNIEKAALKAAWEAGDFEKAADSQVKLSSLSAELIQLNGAKAQAEEQAKAPAQVQRHASADPVEEFIAGNRLPQKSATWLREHPEALAKRARLARAHDEAIEDGAGFESPEYFSTIEKIMGLEKKANGSSDGQDGADGKSTARALAEPRRVPAAPSSSSAGSQLARAREVRMTPEMRKAAEISGITEEEYAKNWLLAKSQGLIQ